MPQPGTALRREPLDIIRGQIGVTGLFVVADMRYFEGPDLPNILEPRPPMVKRWYVKTFLQAKPGEGSGFPGLPKENIGCLDGT